MGTLTLATIPADNPVLYKFSPPWSAPIFKTKQKLTNPTIIPGIIPNFPLIGARHVEKNRVIAKDVSEIFFPNII